MNVGFMHTATKEEGPIGKERLYYLDLDSKHVSSLRLTENEASSISSYSVVDLLKDNQKVGFIALEKRIIELILLLLKCIKNNEKKVSRKCIKTNSTYVRKHFKQAKTIMITLFGENNELKSLCVNSGFVEIDQSDDLIIFEKYVNY